MKKITMIKMQGCPYCAKAAEAIEELRAEQPAYAGIEVEIIDENEQPELAKASAGDRYHFLRMGYYCLDKDATKTKMIFNQTVTLRDLWAKEVKKG